VHPNAIVSGGVGVEFRIITLGTTPPDDEETAADDEQIVDTEFGPVEWLDCEEPDTDGLASCALGCGAAYWRAVAEPS
jgi:hypothetical protein